MSGTGSAGAFLATMISIAYLQRCRSLHCKSAGLFTEDSTESYSSIKIPDDDQREQLQQFLANDHKIYKFVLTGGPCSGKTTAMERLQVFLRERGAKITESYMRLLFL